MQRAALFVCLVVGVSVGLGVVAQVTPEEWAAHFGVQPREGGITVEDLKYLDFIPGVGAAMLTNLRNALPITSAEALGEVDLFGSGWVRFLSALYTWEPSVSTTETTDLPHFVFTEPALVINIVDGDTFDVRWPDHDYVLRIRPASIDTPERGECYFEEATSYAEAILLGRWVWFDRGDPDAVWSYRRLLATVWLDSARTATFGHIMVSQGYARVLSQFPRGRELDALGLEDEAREAARGLWGACP